MALDIFEKFSFLKATTSGESLMHFLARQAEQHNPRLLDLSENWVATWAAADISLKQLNTEVNNLDNLVNKMNAEFIRIKDTKENVGLDGLLEDAKGPAMNPLWRRLNTFLLVAKPRMAAILQQVQGGLQPSCAVYTSDVAGGIQMSMRAVSWLCLSAGLGYHMPAATTVRNPVFINLLLSSLSGA